MRSGFEYKVAQALEEAGIEFEYEAKSYELWLPVHRGYQCEDCGAGAGSIRKLSWYTPDFFTDGFVIEAKGKFTALDRKKALAVREHHPKLRMLYVFMRDNKLSKLSKTRYSEWCSARDLTWAVGPKQMIEVLTQ